MTLLTTTEGKPDWRVIRFAVMMLLLMVGHAEFASAQTNYGPFIITPPIIDAVDENFVSVISGKAQFTIPAVQFGDVSYTPHSYNGQQFAKGGLFDNNYGRVLECHSLNAGLGGYGGRFECAVPSGVGVQAIHGEERATFRLLNGVYQPLVADGSAFVDNGSTCTWTKRDGTKVVYVGFHVANNPSCLSRNISSIIRPNGRITTYHYYGSFSTTASSPILSIATNSGYLLKYNYSGTPTRGGHTSVVAFSRAFETCDPAAISCALTNTWPTATLSWQDKMVSASDDFPSLGTGYDPFRHYLFTIETAARKKHAFELDSYFRVITYQPPGATGPVYSYNICSLLNGSNHPLRHCFGFATWPNNSTRFEPQPLMFDLVSSATRNGQTWSYGASFSPGFTPPAYSTWSHRVTSPLGRQMSAIGNATPGLEGIFGPTDSVTQYDGTVARFARSTSNFVISQQTPAGILTQYAYVQRGNLQRVTRNPVSGSGLGAIVQSAEYPDATTTCSNIFICNKATSSTDANGHQTHYSYDPVHGGVLNVTSPAVNGIRPQVRYTYVQRNAWYFESSGVMTRDARPIWLIDTESYCRTSAAVDSDCTQPGDEVVTTFEYGPDSGPSNLIVRGRSITANGSTLRTCYGHDKQGNKLWETSPNANPSSCPDY